MIFKHFIHWVAAAALVAAAVSCGEAKADPVEEDPVKPDPPVVVDPVEYDFSADPVSLQFPAEGGEATFELRTEAVWTSRCDAEWVTYGHKSGQGDDTIIVSVPANPDSENARSAEILFYPDEEAAKGSLRFVITQDAAAPATVDVKVTTGEATAVTSVSVTLSGSYSGATTEVRDHGFRYGTSAAALTQEAALSSTTGTSKSFSVTLSSLSAETNYYYQAFVTVWDPSKNMYVDVLGSVRSFRTAAASTPPVTPTGLQYLGCYEMPAIDLASREGYSATGKESVGNSNWYNYATGNARQLVVTHTFKESGRRYRNFTILVDQDKKAALWNTFVMHRDVYAEDNNVGRYGTWHEDPGVPSSWQSCFSQSGYSRGHQVASNYRQVSTEANSQTFYYTNQALQFQNGFNDGVWNSLELAVKAGAPSGRDTLYVVVGLLYEDSKEFSGVPVPSHFYKCLMKCSFDSSGKMTGARGDAYCFTNVSHAGESYSKGRTTIDAMEQRSGFDFFANVPKELQEAAEKTSSGVF